MGEGRDIGLHKSRNVCRGHRQVFQDLQNGNRLGDRDGRCIARQPLSHAFHALDNVRVALLNVPLHGVIERDSRCQLAHRGIGKRSLSGEPFDQHLLNDLDRRP